MKAYQFKLYTRLKNRKIKKKHKEYLILLKKEDIIKNNSPIKDGKGGADRLKKKAIVKNRDNKGLTIKNLRKTTNIRVPEIS
jgi:hypothetical protein